MSAAKQNKNPNPYLRFTSVAFQMGATIYLGNYFGTWLDKKRNTDYWENTITMLAVCMAMYLVISQVLKLSNKDD